MTVFRSVRLTQETGLKAEGGDHPPSFLENDLSVCWTSGQTRRPTEFKKLPRIPSVVKREEPSAKPPSSRRMRDMQWTA